MLRERLWLPEGRGGREGEGRRGEEREGEERGGEGRGRAQPFSPVLLTERADPARSHRAFAVPCASDDVFFFVPSGMAILIDSKRKTPGLHNKISVFSDPDPGKSYATTCEQMGS